MTDYYPLLARAVAGLEKNTGEARRVLYERARNALLAQLRNATPTLSEPEITRERLALEEAVRKVEAEAARQSRLAPRGTPPPETPPRPIEKPQTDIRPQPPETPPRPEAPPEIRRSPEAPRQSRATATAPPPTQPSSPPRQYKVTPEGVSTRDPAVETALPPAAMATETMRLAREAYGPTAADAPDLDRVESRTEQPIVRPPARERTRAPVTPPPPVPAPTPVPTPQSEWTPPDPVYGEAEEEPAPARRRTGPLARRGGRDYEEARPPNPARRGLIAALLTILVIAGLGATAYWQRERISTLFGVVKGLGPSAQRDAPQARPKAADRVGQDGAPAQPAQQPAGTPGARPTTPPPQVAQRVVLYEEDPANPEGNRYVGSALWRTETVSPGPGLSPELAIRADVEIPERRLAMTMSIRRNTDRALPASHTVEILFNLPADFQFGGVANVPGLLMKEAEQARGAPLSGLAVKVTNGFFLIGLSSVDTDLTRNLQLLQERGWFDIPIVYNNGRRAILAVEKGNPGERAFNEAFATWQR